MIETAALNLSTELLDLATRLAAAVAAIPEEKIAPAFFLILLFFVSVLGLIGLERAEQEHQARREARQRAAEERRRAEQEAVRLREEAARAARQAEENRRVAAETQRV